jgi:hypothetical protein
MRTQALSKLRLISRPIHQRYRRNNRTKTHWFHERNRSAHQSPPDGAFRLLKVKANYAVAVQLTASDRLNKEPVEPVMRTEGSLVFSMLAF